MKQHMDNALAVAKYLEAHPMVKQVLHPGLPSHPQYELAQRQCTGFSGTFSFYLNGNLEQVCEFIKNLKIFTLAESLGSIESLIEVPSIMTHASVPPETREQLGITDSLIRASVGIEGVDDLINDLKEALDKAKSAQ